MTVLHRLSGKVPSGPLFIFYGWGSDVIKMKKIDKLNVTSIYEASICPIKGLYRYSYGKNFSGIYSETSNEWMDLGKTIHDVYENTDSAIEFEIQIKSLRGKKYGNKAALIIEKAEKCNKYFMDLIKNYYVWKKNTDLTAKINGTEVIGRPDKIFEMDAGAHEVIEIKTSKPKTTEMKIANKLQLKTYLYLMELNSIPAHGTILYLKDDIIEETKLKENDKAWISEIITDLEGLLDNPFSFEEHKKREDFCQITKCKYLKICRT